MPVKNPKDEGSIPSTSTIPYLGGQRSNQPRRSAPRPAEPSRRERTDALPIGMLSAMTQFVTRVDPQLAEAVDALVESGVVDSRSDAVRAGLTELVERHRRQKVGDRIRHGYREQPQTDNELLGLDEATRALIAEEPW